jgi:hypothetical protein
VTARLVPGAAQVVPVPDSVRGERRSAVQRVPWSVRQQAQHPRTQQARGPALVTGAAAVAAGQSSPAVPPSG